MANEITTQITTSVLNPKLSTSGTQLIAEFDRTFQLTQTTAAVFSDTVTVTTSEQDLSLPTSSKFTAALQGLWCAVNLDSTNYVKFGPKSGGNMVEFGRLYPKYLTQIPIAPSVVLRWVADTASCSVLFVWFAK